MARRQPSSVLSICISLILLTSSVSTLSGDRWSGLKGQILHNATGAEGKKSRLPVKDGPDLCTLHVLPVTKHTAVGLRRRLAACKCARVSASAWRPYLSKMAPTPALLALSRCSSEASRTPSLELMERWENDAMSSSFQPRYDAIRGGSVGRASLSPWSSESRRGCALASPAPRCDRFC